MSAYGDRNRRQMLRSCFYCGAETTRVVEPIPPNPDDEMMSVCRKCAPTYQADAFCSKPDEPE